MCKSCWNHSAASTSENIGWRDTHLLGCDSRKLSVTGAFAEPWLRGAVRISRQILSVPENQVQHLHHCIPLRQPSCKTLAYHNPKKIYRPGRWETRLNFQKDVQLSSYFAMWELSSYDTQCGNSTICGYAFDSFLTRLKETSKRQYHTCERRSLKP